MLVTGEIPPRKDRLLDRSDTADQSGEDMLVCMTRMFDLIHEEPLRKDEFGEGMSPFLSASRL